MSVYQNKQESFSRSEYYILNAEFLMRSVRKETPEVKGLINFKKCIASYFG